MLNKTTIFTLYVSAFSCIFWAVSLASCSRHEKLTAEQSDRIRILRDSAAYFADTLQNMKEALKYREAELELLMKGGDRKDIAQAQYEIGRLHINMGSVNKALPSILESLESALRTHDASGIRRCQNALGDIYYNASNSSAALNFYRQASVAPVSRDDIYESVIAKNNIATILMSRDSTAESFQLIKECLDSCRVHDFQDLLLEISCNYVYCLLQQGDIEEAGRHLYGIRQYIRNDIDSGAYSYCAGAYHYIAHDYDSSLFHFHRAVDFYSKGENPEPLSSSYYNLYMMYKIMGDEVRSLEALENYLLYKEESENEEIIIDLYRTQNERNIQRAEEISHLNRIKYTQNVIIIISVALVLMVTGVLILRSRRHEAMERENSMELDRIRLEQEKKQLENEQKLIEYELDTKNELMKIQKLQQYQKNLMIEKIISKLEALHGSIRSKSAKESIFGIISELKENDNDTSWDELEKYLTNHNSPFFTRLSKDFPNLTLNERRLCAFLQMNMTSKEISAITRQSVNSIIMARFRLRKKLEIQNPDTSIYSFLQRYESKEDGNARNA